MAGIVLQRQYGDEQVGPAIIGNNSEVFVNGDQVTIDTNGNLFVAAAGRSFLGYYSGPGETLSATNETVAKKCPRWIWADMVTVKIAAVAGVTPVQTDIGEFSDLSVATTGAQTLASPTEDTAAQFLVVGISDEDGDGTMDTFICIGAQLLHRQAGEATVD